MRVELIMSPVFSWAAMPSILQNCFTTPVCFVASSYEQAKLDLRAFTALSIPQS